MTREKCSCYQHIYRHTSGTGHKRDNEHRDQTAFTAFYSPCSHYRRHVASESHDHRNERLSMKTDLMHEPVHDEGSSCHITGVFQQRYEQIKQEYVRKEDKNASDTADDTIHYKILQPSVCHDGRNKCSESLNHPFDPSHRILSDDKSGVEYNIKQEKEYRECQPLVSNESIYLICKRMPFPLAGRRNKSLSQRTLHEGILGIHHRGLQT